MRKKAALVCAVVCLTAFAKSHDLFAVKLSKDQRTVQALNRLTFGPRPGDVERVRSMGLKKWIDLQLHPDRIAENPVLLEKLRPLDTLAMSPAEMAQNYPPPELVRSMVNGRVPFPNDPEKRALIRKLVERYEKRVKNPGQFTDDSKVFTALFTPEQHRALRTGTPEQKVAVFRALPPEQQAEALTTLPPAIRNGLYTIAPPDLRRKIEMTYGPQQVVVQDLASAKLYRAIYSNRQLDEVLTDFWFNHFNVFLDKGADRYLVTSYERDVIRPHVLGKFRDLLEATAKSPAMLYYLDNWQSAGPNKAARGRTRGLNENYGRELLELHTLGVDGGYTQKDVTEAARCFTGWTIKDPYRAVAFEFNARMHDDGEKTVLGVKISAGGGISDGETVLDIVARHPSTARFISRKLAMRFVADNPPPALVDRMAETFRKTDGDIREVLKTMLASKEFWSEGAFRSKMKSPLEMIASAVRAVDGDVDYTNSLVSQIAQLGEPLYRKLEPTGYSNSSAEWLNSAGLLARLNFAVALNANKVPGLKIDPARVAAVNIGAPEFQKR